MDYFVILPLWRLWKSSLFILLGKSELVMFGGIQKDVSSISRGGANGGASGDGDTVSNAVYFLNPPSNVIWLWMYAAQKINTK